MVRVEVGLRCWVHSDEQDGLYVIARPWFAGDDRADMFPLEGQNFRETSLEWHTRSKVSSKPPPNLNDPVGSDAAIGAQRLRKT